MRNRVGAYAVLAVVVLVSHLPFIGQAFHIDDRIYLEIAENIRDRPFHPYDYAPVFEGLISADAASHSHLPLTSYYLALVSRLTGSRQEWVYHLAFLIFPLLAAWGFYGILRRVVRFPLAGACLLLAAPAFAVLSHTLMTEVPLLAFWLVSLDRFLLLADGKGKGRDFWILAAALLGAAFISLLSAGLLMLMAAWLTARPQSRVAENRRLWLLIALPLVLWFFWYLLAYVHYGRMVLINTWLHMDKRQAFDSGLLGVKALSFLLNIGGIFIFPLALWYGLARTVSLRVFLLILLFSFVPFYAFLPGWRGSQVVLFAVFFASGLLLVWHFLQKARATWMQRNVEWLCVLWFFGMLAACLLLFYAGSVRYAVLALPPVLLVWQRSLEERITSDYFRRNLVAMSLILTALYGALISLADYRFAGSYRRMTAQIVEDYRRDERNIWFTGEWGFRYYLERSGARILPRTATGPQPGDILVKPFVASPWVTLYDGDEHLALLEQRYVEESFPLRMLDFSSHAGFYSTGWGLLPFSLGGDPQWEWFNIFQIKKEYTGVIPEAEKHF